MIWIWISVAILISVFLLRGKHISLENYIWILLPIDMYGISVAGIIVKPYMILCGILFIMYIKNRSGDFFIGSVIIPFILIGTLIVNIFNGGTDSSLLAIFMVMLVYTCACVYISKAKESISEIPEVVVAASIGYGLVFFVLNILFNMGIRLPDVATRSNLTPGILLALDNMNGDVFYQTYRLRGFNIDPNASVGVFLAAFPIDMIMLISNKGSKKRYLISFLLSLACVYLTNSRMGILAALIIVILTSIRAIKIATREQRRKFIQVIISLGFVLLFAILFSDINQRLGKDLFSAYEGRADFNAQYGRGSIWKESIEIWNEKSLFWGVGTGNIRYLISTRRQTHNTWLEWLCGCGLLFGSAVILIFIVLIIKGFNTDILGTREDKTLFQVILMGLMGMVICLIAIDNTTNCYLWFFTVTIMKLFSLSEKRIGQRKCKYLKA